MKLPYYIINKTMLENSMDRETKAYLVTFFVFFFWALGFFVTFKFVINAENFRCGHIFLPNLFWYSS